MAQSYKSIHEEMTNGDYGDSKYDAFRCAMVANTPGWSNKMFVRPDLMPHQIQITDIKIERLQDISDEDCWKEGIIQSVDGVNMYTFDGWIKKGYQQYSYTSPRKAFASLIDRISGNGTWQSNPIVVAYSFKLIK